MNKENKTKKTIKVGDRVKVITRMADFLMFKGDGTEIGRVKEIRRKRVNGAIVIAHYGVIVEFDDILFGTKEKNQNWWNFQPEHLEIFKGAD